MFTRLSCYASLIFCPQLAWTQAAPKFLDFNQHVWVSYSGEHQIGQRLGIHFDAQWRRADIGTEWQQYQMRPGLNYRWSPDVLLTAGYAFTRTYPTVISRWILPLVNQEL